MAGFQRGAGAGGITGIVDVSGAPQFTAQCLFFDKNGGVKKIVRTGRGNTGIEQTRSGTEVTTILLKGKVIADGFPEPTNLRDASGTITFQFTADPTGTIPLKIIYSVIFEGSTIKFNEKTEDGWDIQIAATVTAYPTYSGWPGTQVTPTPPSLSDQETYEGLSKVYDTNGLLTAATQRIDVVNLADTDAAEDAKLAAVVAAAVTPPMTYLKVVTATFERTDKLGGTIVIQWGLQDSKDRVETPENIVTTDPNDLLSETASALVYNAGSPPSTPSTPSGQKLYNYVDKKLNDQKYVRIFKWTKNDSKDDYQDPDTWTVADPNNLRSVASSALVDATPSTPGGYVSRTIKTITIKTGHTLVTRDSGLRTTAEDIERPGTHTIVDPNNLESTAKVAKVAGTPSLPGGFVERNTDTYSENSLTQVKTITGGLRTTAEDIERPNTHTIVDPHNLASRAQVAKVAGTPSLPAGYVERETDTYSENSLAQVKTIKGGLRTTLEDITFPGTWAELDPLAVDSKGQDTAVYLTSGGVPSPPSPPSAELQIVSTQIELENELMSKRIVRFEELTSKQKRLFPKIKTYDDAQNIEDTAVRAQYWAVGDTPPATPTDTPVNNVKLIGFTDIPDTPALNIRIWVYGEKNSRDDVVQPHYETTADASNLEATAIRACLDGESITDPSGYTLRFTKTIPLTFSLGVNRTLTIKIYGLRTVANDLQMPNTWTRVDAFNAILDATHQLEGRGQKLTVYTTAGGVPADPSPPSGLQIVSSRIVVENDITSSKQWDFEVNNPLEKIIYPASRSFRSAQEPYIDVVLGVYPCLASDTNTALANSYWGSFQNSPNAWSVQVVRKTAVLIEVTYTYRDPGILVFEETFGENIPVFCRDSPGSPGTPQVYLSQKWTRGSSTFWARLGEARINQVVREFSISRQYTGSTFKDFTSLENQTNNASFLGLAAGRVLYVGAEMRTNIALSSTWPFSAVYHFRYCSNAFYNVYDFTGLVLLGSDPGSLGWINASAANVHTDTPTTASFSVFTGALP